MIEVYSRINDSQIWQYQTFEKSDEIIAFDRLGISLPVAVIYEEIGFEGE